MKHLALVLFFCALGHSTVQAFDCNESVLVFTDSLSVEHHPSLFDAQKLESATQAKYVGLGLSIAGGALALNGNGEAGTAVSIAGAIVTLAGIIGQDIQLVRLGWKHQKKQGRVNAALTTANGNQLVCSDLGLVMGDRVAFSTSSGADMTGEIVGMINAPSASSGCQVIVRYSLDGEFRTSTLSPSSLTKVAE